MVWYGTIIHVGMSRSDQISQVGHDVSRHPESATGGPRRRNRLDTEREN